MTDDDLTRFGFTAKETAKLNRLLARMDDGPPPPKGCQADESPSPETPRGVVIACAVVLLLAVALALWVEISVVLF